MQNIENRENKSTLIAIKISLEFLTAFELELQHNPNTSVNDFYHKFLAHIHWDQPSKRYNLINQGSLLAHLYGMVVYPKETLSQNLSMQKKFSEFLETTWGRFDIVSLPNGIRKEDIQFEFFFRKLRNAISHGNVEVDSTMKFYFKDKDGTEIVVELDELVKFMYALYNASLNDWNL